jgi:spore maturation protein CgeB
MKILYAAMKYDYGDPERGLSFEHTNFYSALTSLGHDLHYFDFMTLLQELGRDEMNRRLLELARSEVPDIMFTFLFTDELDPKVVETISRDTSTITLNWFADDHWRFETYSARWAPRFNWVVTTAASAIPKYERIGYRHAIKSQWACNDAGYRKLDLPMLYDVSFVGQPHGNRRQVIEAIRSAGIDVHTRGFGWPEGRVTQEEMVRIFNQSRINLNLPNASSKPLTRIGLLWSDLVRAVAAKPLGARVVHAARRAFTTSNGTRGETPWLPEQIKGRNFEVPGCGGFLLTGPADELDAYYEPGREVAVFTSADDLIEKIRYYLDHEDERRAIADAGYARTVAEHTYRHRFAEIFAAIGLPARPPGTLVQS